MTSSLISGCACVDQNCVSSLETCSVTKLAATEVAAPDTDCEYHVAITHTPGACAP